MVISGKHFILLIIDILCLLFLICIAILSPWRLYYNIIYYTKEMKKKEQDNGKPEYLKKNQHEELGLQLLIFITFINMIIDFIYILPFAFSIILGPWRIIILFKKIKIQFL
eukprot:Anaeramoba_flamelloidesc39193_g1_i1.p2 GENE.c39193_g1_i1~~c39193_g1_i1.p2  ORF type:complete len:111 (+),score=7.92 c39193_g1_i1:1028-1360(+)